MGRKITIAQLDINIEAMKKKSGELLGNITALKTAQKELRDSTKKLTEADDNQLKKYAQTDAQLKKLQTDYNQQKNILAEVTTGVKDLSGALEKEVKSVRDAQKNNSKLVKIRNQVNTKTKEGQVAISQINAKLTRNNSLIHKNSSALEKQRLNIGNYKSALRGLGSVLRSAGLIGGVAGLVLAFKGLFKIISSFQAGVSNLASVLDKPVSQIKELSDNAIKLGASTAKTAKEVLGLQEAYARLGFKQQEIIDLTKPTINASVALNSNLSDTANLAGAVVNSFDDLSTTDAPLILDQITASTQNSALTFEKLQTGIPNVAAAASAAGIPFSKLLALLGKLADSGIDASKSSTSLRNIFIESAKDGSSYEQILEKIKGSQNKLTAANDEFGKRAAVSAIALSKNIDSTKELDLVIQGAAGTAQRAADTQLDNLSGAITLLSSGFDGFILSLENGTGGTAKFARGIIDATTSMFNFLTPTQKVSEALEKEQIKINDVVLRLGDLNLKEGERLKLINELNTVAPDLVTTLNDQGIATDKTRIALDKLNESFIANIALQIKAEEITEVATAEAEARLRLFDKEKELRDQLAKIRREGTNEQKTFIDQGQKEGKTYLEIANALKAVSAKRTTYSQTLGTQTKFEESSIRVLDEYVSRVEIAEVVLGRASEKTNDLREETNKLRDSFIEAGLLSDEIVPDPVIREKTITRSHSDEIVPDPEALQEVVPIKAAGYQELSKLEDAHLDERIANLKKHNDARMAELKGQAKLEIERVKDEEDKKKEIKLASIDLINDIADGAIANRRQKNDAQFAEERLRLSERYNTDVQLLQNKLDKGQINEKQFAEEKKKLDKKQASDLHKIKVAEFNSDKKISLGKIAINTAVAIGKSIVASPLTLGLPWSAFAAAQGLIQAIVVSAQKPPPTPKFATGTKRVLGVGTETSDSVPALLSKNERVVDAKNNKRIGFDLSNDQLATAAQMYRSMKLNGGTNLGGQGIVDAINKNTKVLKGKAASSTSLHVTDGFKVVNRTKYLT